MKENEKAVNFTCDVDLINEFTASKACKEKTLGIDLSIKQAFCIAMKEAIKRWEEES